MDEYSSKTASTTAHAISCWSVMAWLNNYRFDGWIDVNTPRLLKTWFHELLLTFILGLMTALLDVLWTVTGIKSAVADGCCHFGFAFAPLAFLLIMTFFKSGEKWIFRQISFWLGIKFSSNASITQTSFYGLTQKLFILLYICAISLIPIQGAPYNDASHNWTSEDIWNNTRQLLRVWYYYQSYLLGSYALVSFCRLQIDTVILTYRLWTETGPKSEEQNDTKKPEPEKLPSNNNIDRTDHHHQQ